MGQRSKNRALVRFVLLPTIFLLVVLLGGLRVGAQTRAFIFLPPPLITLILAVLLMLLFARGRLIEFPEWVSSDRPALTNVSHALTLLALFFASAQAFNSVMPESGLLHWLFSFFLLWTLWNNQFAGFDARKLLRSLSVLFGTAFALKHLLLASLYAPEGGWLRRLTGALLEGVALGTLDTESFAPATGYLSFFTLALYVVGLILLAPSPHRDESHEAHRFLRAYEKLSSDERLAARQAIQAEQAGPVIETRGETPQLSAAKRETVDEDELDEETVIKSKPKTS
ncbi:MAG TPA: hypothetical protein VGO91_12160 [Pyrinomonadaceae bacterium]|jgi:hypothetical protein|nr:hypothetical protein [Pyrinomonadaceae bacterium]